MVGHVFSLDELPPVDFRRFDCPSESTLFGVTHTHSNFLHASLDEKVGDKLVVVALSHRVARDAPLVLWTVRLTYAVQPSIQRPVVIFDAMVTR